MSGKVERRGGARSGSGRKPLGLSEKEQRSLVKEMRAVAKERGKTPARVLAEIIYDDETNASVRVKGLDLYFSKVIEKKPDQSLTVITGPTIGLPEIATPDPEYIVTCSEDVQ